MSEAKVVTSKFPEINFPIPPAASKAADVEPYSPNSRAVVREILLQERQETLRRRDLSYIAHRALLVIGVGALAIAGMNSMTMFIPLASVILAMSWMLQDRWAEIQLRAIDNVLIGQEEDADRFIVWKWDIQMKKMTNSMRFLMRFEPYLWLLLTWAVTLQGAFIHFKP